MPALACRVIQKMLISEFLELNLLPSTLVMSGNYDLHADEGLSVKGK